MDLSQQKPRASRVVRPVLEIDLPLLDGLTLSDFAQVTSEAFDSYIKSANFYALSSTNSLARWNPSTPR